MRVISTAEWDVALQKNEIQRHISSFVLDVGLAIHRDWLGGFLAQKQSVSPNVSLKLHKEKKRKNKWSQLQVVEFPIALNPEKKYLFFWIQINSMTGVLP